MISGVKSDTNWGSQVQLLKRDITVAAKLHVLQSNKGIEDY